MQKVNYLLTGSSPILFHNVNCMDLVKPKKLTHAEFESSDEMFRARLYLGKDDELTLPPRMILGGLKTAAQKSGIKQDGKRSTYASIIRAVVFCPEPGTIKQKLTDVVLHKEYVTIMKSKILRVFPMLANWEVNINLSFDDRQISQEALDDIWEYAGNYCGFGDYRPQYGRFTVNKID